MRAGVGAGACQHSVGSRARAGIHAPENAHSLPHTQVEPAPFDPNAVEMVKLVAEGAGAKDKTHFYPMAMATHNIFPPPQTVGGEFGEERRVQWTHLVICVF